ncbi:MAG: alpha/beta hydrolase [Acidobacteriota bacterium]
MPRAHAVDYLFVLAGLLIALGVIGCHSNPPVIDEIEQAVADLEEDALCDLARDLFAEPMTAPPLYASNDGSCAAIDPDTLDDADARQLFADPACQDTVAYGGTSWKAFCEDNLLDNEQTRTTIGNPDAWSNHDPSVTEHVETRWTAPQEVRMRLASVDQTPLARPFRKQVEYRRIDGCALGLHVYRQDLAATDAKPLILIHGGGWKYRGLGAVAGLGTMAPHFTSRGYVVFAPFYRLIETADGPAACHGASGADILADIEAAFAWVREHGARYGARSDGPIAVAGQSAGGHLAAYLATLHPTAIDRGLLLYPAPDLGFFARGVQPGGIYDGRFESSQGLLVSFFAQPDVTTPEGLDLADPEMARNSFPPIIQTDPRRYPVLEIVHGDADTTVPVELSTRLCQALDPTESPSHSAYTSGGEQRLCGDAGSRLTVVDGADHILDLRCFSGRAAELLDHLSPELDTLCTPGSVEGEATVQSTLVAAYRRF